MKKLIDLIYNASYSQIVKTAFFVGVVISIPTVVVLSNTQTSITSQAKFVPPSSKPIIRSLAPEVDSVIQEVRPFIAKAGDVIILKGQNFGFFPKKAYITIGNTVIPEDHIESWKDDKISFYAPSGAKSGKIRVFNGNSETIWDKILTIYDKHVKTQIVKEVDGLKIKNATSPAKLLIAYKDELQDKEISFYPDMEKLEAIIEEIKTEGISWLTLLGPADNALSFYVDPEEFGF